MSKNNYDFNTVEEKWRKFWEKEKIYKFDPSSNKKIFSVDTPPPTISGRLHMGHAFGDAQQDFFVRFKRMRGFNVLNPFGTDNNGLPTLKLVEKEKKVDSRKMKREDFIDLCNKVIHEEFIPMFLDGVKRLGISADFDLFYSTIDKRSRKISQKSFLDLYKIGREYRLEAPALWCPNCQTTIAQMELEDKEVKSSFVDIVFKVDGKNLIISTTRPELLPASVAMFYHPKDKRYKHLKGKNATVPLFNFEVPILEDERAEMDKGTGIAYCATFGDQTDMEWQKIHKLPIKEAITLDGKMTSIAGEYKGMDIKDARRKIINDLREKKLLLNEKKIIHIVNVCERCGTEVEFISHKQWFVKYLDLKKDMLKWGKEIKWHPRYMRQRYNNWIHGLKWDWCISRQIPFGIPFPVWYCKNCDEVILAKEKDLPVDPVEDKPSVKTCPKCNCKEFIPEKDIMNTWATSSLTPTIIHDLLKDTKISSKIKNKPMDIRRNGQDIITFWDFNTIVKSQLHYKINPWKELYINGWILGRDGHKMSKSRGNGISPDDVIKEWGADVLRYLSSSVKPGEAVAFSDKELVAGKKFITKLLNASKFVFMNLEDYNGKKPKKLEKIDELFLIKLNNLIQEATNYFEIYEFSKAKAEIEKFFWQIFCDNYLEIIKKRIYNEKGDKRISAQYTLYQSLLAMLKMIAPLMPFIAEEIYQGYFKKTQKDKSIHLSNWPEKMGVKGKTETFDLMIEVISKVRQKKSKAKKAMNSEIILTLEKKQADKLKSVVDDLMAVTNAQEIKSGRFKVEFV
ncbi:MAG: valine--tRNA ligase [Nanoarchaeota archaeon]|nr:valine--tRNA ligase [Nanoarchaeota archaeon]